MCVCVCACVCVCVCGNCYLCCIREQTIEVFDWYSLSIVLNISENEAFAGEALFLGEISFLIILSSVGPSGPFSLVSLKTCNSTEDSSGNKHF